MSQKRKTIQLSITQEDIDRAVEAAKDTLLITRCCPITQAMNRVYPQHVFSTSNKHIYYRDSPSAVFELSAEAEQITHVCSLEWNTLQPTTVEIDEVEVAG